ncbi:MAG: hypothetical protein V7749_00205 [Cocleimonas sp.]
MFSSAVNATEAFTPHFSDDWKGELRNIEFRADQFALFDNQPKSQLFRSGASAKNDLLGLIRAKVPVCVNVSDTSQAVRTLLRQYSHQQQILLDSGAFRLFKNNIKTGETHELDFKSVLNRYREIINMSDTRSNIIFVCPDVVGQQSTSMALINTFLAEITDLLQAGANMLIPLQKGTLSISQCYHDALSLIPSIYQPQLIIGLPSNAAALSVEEVISFLKTDTPPKVHFLGASEDQLVHRSLHASPNTQLSNDATRIRKWVGKGKLLTTMHQSILDEAIDIVWSGSAIPHLEQSGLEFDFTEFLGSLTDYVEQSSSCQLKRLATKLCTTAGKLMTACTNDNLIGYIDGLNFGYSDHLLYEFHEEECRKKLSPKIRQYAVYRLASLGLI